MIFMDREKDLSDEIYSIGNYHSYWSYGEKNPNFDAYSGLLLDLKEEKEDALNHFHRIITSLIKSEFVIAVVPSHDPSKVSSGVRKLAQMLVASKSLINGTNCLIRHTKIEKLAHGGNRALDVHLNSISVHAPNLNLSKVLILDDITTSGNSLYACRQLFYNAGARKVKCMALGKTV